VTGGGNQNPWVRQEGTQADSVVLLAVGVNFGLRHQQQLLGIPRVASLFL